MKQGLKAFIGVTCFVATIVATSVANAAPTSTTTTATLIDVAVDLPINGVEKMIGPFNVSKYSEISILGHAAGVAVGTPNVGVYVIFTPTATPIPYTSILNLDLKGGGVMSAVCTLTQLGPYKCGLDSANGGIKDLPTSIPVLGPYVSFVLIAPTTATLKLWAKP